MMDDVISRKAAIDALKEHRNLFCDNTPDTFSVLPYGDKCRVDELDMAIATLINLPSAEPERKKGKWLTEYLDGIPGRRAEIKYCSECCQVSPYRHNFCPNCGARLEVEE